MFRRLRQLGGNVADQVRLYRRICTHPRTPWVSRILLGLAVTYLLMPFDLIPDFLPIVGWLDDVMIVPGLVGLAMILVPPAVVSQCRVRGRPD